jgi:AraC-like DNA-binding protein
MPVAALSRHVDRVWINELRGPTAIDVVPDGCIDIYWTGGGLQIAGPNTEVVTITMPSAAKLAGVRFHPGVAGRWLGVPATELVNRHQPLDEVWDRRAVDELSDRLAHAGSAAAAAMVLEQALIARLPEVAPADPIVEATVAAMIRAGSTTKSVVGELIADFSWSERTLRRHSHEAFGYGPKTLERILRFQRFLRLLPAAQVPLAVLASEAGYADQAHLAREVRRLSGQSPSGLMAELRA